MAGPLPQGPEQQASPGGRERRAPRFPAAPHNRVVPVLLAFAAAAAIGSGYVRQAPNRLLSGTPLMLWQLPARPGLLAAPPVLAALVLAAAWVRPAPGRQLLAAGLAASLLIASLALAGDAAASLPGRISLGPAAWCLALAAALCLLDALQRLAPRRLPRLVIPALLLAAVGLLARHGLFDRLSLAQEYAAHRDGFARALARHAGLVLGATLPALSVGVPLGIAAARRPRLRGPLFGVLNLLQTIPSVALFGLLIAPLSALAAAFPGLAALGVGGIGAAPALVALVLYALLPVARSTTSGLTGVDAAVLETAAGLGFTRTQVFWRVELPLAAPVLLAGLRVVVVQAIGLTVVAALIGAGGLGTFVFEGIGQYATDLVLLGALPAILMALAADALLAAAAGAARRAVRAGTDAR